jgi:hypothetical protein
MSDHVAMVGAFQDNDAGLASGSAYFFKENGLGDWFQVSKLVSADAGPTEAFGFAVGASGDIGLVGAPLNSTGGTDAGAAYLFHVPAGIPGDYNLNGAVDAADYALWRDMLGQSGSGLAADGNGDGTVNDADFDMWRANLGLGALPAPGSSLQAASAPEPGSAVIILFAILGLATGFARRPQHNRSFG